MTIDEEMHDRSKVHARGLARAKRALEIGDVATVNSTVGRSQFQMLSITSKHVDL